MPSDVDAWLVYCRRLHPTLSDAEFKALRQDFLRLYRELLAVKRRQRIPVPRQARR